MRKVDHSMDRCFQSNLVEVFNFFVHFQQLEPIEDDIFASFKNPTYTVSPKLHQ